MSTFTVVVSEQLYSDPVGVAASSAADSLCESKFQKVLNSKFTKERSLVFAILSLAALHLSAVLLLLFVVY
jgi:hypothetical protein